VLEPEECFDANDSKIAKIYTHPNYRVLGRGWSLLKDLDIWFMRRLVRILQDEQVDLIAIEYPSGALAAKLATIFTKTSVPIVYSPHNVESSFASEVISRVSQFSSFEKKMIPPYITALEKFTTKYLADHITAVSEADKDLLCGKYSLDRRKVTVIPSGCELEDLVDPQVKERLRVEMGYGPNSTIVVFHGSYSHPPNRDAIDAIINHIAPVFKADKSIVFALYGLDVPKFEQENVKSFGFVKDLHHALSIADIALVPLTTGGGTKLKIFDYMNAGLPIITTPTGIKGIRANDQEHVIIVENINKEIISAIKYLVQNREERQRLGLNARKLAENEYNWDIIGDKLDYTYRQLRANGPQ
jgi:polysaccharide biosynthesis protein PslH